MNTWSAGYVEDIDYSYKYFPELNPESITLAFLRAGLKPPMINTACELGFGQGVSSNIHACNSSIKWFGTDFNPSQASFADEISKTTGNSAYFYDQAFVDFCNREDLPNFDFIALHGVWSWVSDEDRKTIVNFIQRKLNLNGIVYISYNTLPGFSNVAPIRRLLADHVATFGSREQGIKKRIQNSIDFTSKAISLSPKLLKSLPTIQERLNKIEGQSIEYLAHEYYNENWVPMYFSEISDWLRPAKIEFACTASYSEAVDPLHLSDEQIEILLSVNDLTFRETLKDFFVFRQFRKDYWVKGKRHLNSYEMKEEIRTKSVALCASKKKIPKKVIGSRGEATLPPQVYEPIIEALDESPFIKIEDLEKKLANYDISYDAIIQSLFVLIGLGVVSGSVKKPNDSNLVKKFNAYIIEMAKLHDKIHFLISPLTGCVLTASRFELLFLLSTKKGKKTLKEKALFVWNIMSKQGELIVKDGKILKSEEENINELQNRASEFVDEKLPILKKLEIA